jgi:hypothetical protein
MLLPILFPKIYVQCTIEGRLIERSFTNVKTMAWWVREFASGTYRDGCGTAAGRLTAWNSTSMMGVSPPPPIASDVPIFGGPNRVPSSSSFGGLSHVVSDEWAHIPPRPMMHKEGGVLIGVTDAPLPTAPPPEYYSLGFTINVGSNVCTIGGGGGGDPDHPPLVEGMAHGDKVVIAATTAPVASAKTPYALSELATVVRVSTNTFLLKNAAGQIIDFSSGGLGCRLILVTSVRPPDPIPMPFSFFREEWLPRIYTDPPI